MAGTSILTFASEAIKLVYGDLHEQLRDKNPALQLIESSAANITQNGKEVIFDTHIGRNLESVHVAFARSYQLLEPKSTSKLTYTSQTYTVLLRLTDSYSSRHPRTTKHSSTLLTTKSRV